LSKIVLAQSCIALLLAAVLCAARPVAAQAQQDFLTPAEASKVRNALSADARIDLFLNFAADRLQRFEHELQAKGAGPLRSDFLNDLLDSFTSCVDEASDRVGDAMSSGENARAGIRDVRKRVPQFLSKLKEIQAEGVDLKAYRDSLSDAQADLRDDLREAAKDAKQLQFNSPKSKPSSRAVH
jgi:Asp-tRNA(Asn)/Glu-tRNA(Gln) amidotransferase C subunit